MACSPRAGRYVAGELASDDLAERFDRPYGTVWTETVLLDASPAKLDTLVDRYRGELGARRVWMTAVQFGAAALRHCRFGSHIS